MEIIEKEIEYPWVRGEVRTDDGESVRFSAKVFMEGSSYGINNGRISKLWFVVDGNTVNYDRGWDCKPKSDKAKKIYKALLKEYNR